MSTCCSNRLLEVEDSGMEKFGVEDIDVEPCDCCYDNSSPDILATINLVIAPLLRVTSSLGYTRTLMCWQSAVTSDRKLRLPTVFNA